MPTKTLFFTTLLISLIVAGCKPWPTDAAKIPWEGEITFSSQRSIWLGHKLVHGGVGHIFMANEDGTQAGYMSNIRVAHPFPVAWNPSGDTSVVTLFDTALEMHCLEMITESEQECLVPFGYSPSWSPDGNWISYHQENKTGILPSLNIVHVNTREIISLVNLPEKAPFMDSSWSPDSQQIAFGMPDDSDTFFIWLISANGDNLTKLTPGNFPAWSALNELAFVRDGNIWVMDMSSRQETLLVDDPKNASMPAWSPDGNYLLFESYRDGNGEVYRVKRDGSELVNLTNNSYYWDGYPSWRPK